MCISKISEDDSYLDLTCFNVHQSLELLLKYIIESLGYQAPKTHAIDDLLEYTRSFGFEYSRFDELQALTYEVNKWETTSRYGSGIKTTISKVNVILNHIDQIKKEFGTILEDSSELDKVIRESRGRS